MWKELIEKSEEKPQQQEGIIVKVLKLLLSIYFIHLYYFNYDFYGNLNIYIEIRVENFNRFFNTAFFTSIVYYNYILTLYFQFIRYLVEKFFINLTSLISLLVDFISRKSLINDYFSGCYSKKLVCMISSKKFFYRI
jgi:hypothetical protein